MFKPTYRRIVAVERTPSHAWLVTLACGHTTDGVAHMDFSESVKRHEDMICCSCSDTAA